MTFSASAVRSTERIVPVPSVTKSLRSGMLIATSPEARDGGVFPAVVDRLSWIGLAIGQNVPPSAPEGGGTVTAPALAVLPSE